MPKPNILAVETAVTDVIYTGRDNPLKQQFFDALPSLLDATPEYRGILKAAPRPGENIFIPAEAFDAALLQFGMQHGLVKEDISAPEARSRWIDAVATDLFGSGHLQAGGSLANSFDAMVHSSVGGETLVDGTFLTAVGDDAEGRTFESSLQGHINATRGGRQFVAHIIPTGKDRIIIATSSSTDPCDRYLDANKLNDPSVLNENTDMVMLGGYLFYTPHFDAVFDTALARIEALNVQRADIGKPPIKLVLTCAAQSIAANPDFRKKVQQAVCVTDTIIHANTGEFRRLLECDTQWREPFEPQWQGLEGGALEAAKKADPAYQDAKAEANKDAIRRAETVAHLQNRPDGALPGHRTTRVQFIVTNGAKSTYVVDADGCREYPVASVDRSKIVNTVGAGDNFAGGYELGVALGKSEAQCIQLAGSFAGAVICQDPPRLPADATRDYVSAGHSITAGGALAALPDTATSRALLEKLAAPAQSKGI